MKKNWSLSLFVMLFFACQSEQKQAQLDDSIFEATDTTSLIDSAQPTIKKVPETNANPNKILVTCEAVGKIKISDSYAAILAKVGKPNVTTDSVMVEGKFYGTYCTKVWKGTAGELTINWQEAQLPYETIQSIVIDNSNATYVLQNGLKIGSKLSLVNQLNKKPFSLYGFEGKNRGAVVSFEGGNLVDQFPCLRLVFSLPRELSTQMLAKVPKNAKILSSDHSLFKAVDPVVSQLIINSDR